MLDNLNTEKSIKIKLIDQALVNYLIYHKKNFNDCLIKNYSKNGIVLTIGNGKNFKFDLEDNLLNSKEEIAAVIHQYDRHPLVVKKVMIKYCSEVFYQLVKEEKIKKFIICFGACVLILEIFFFLRNLIKKNLKNQIIILLRY